MIHTRRFGTSDGVPTLLAHCFLGSSKGWEPLVEALAPRLDAEAFDMPGHGRSPMPDHVEDLHELVTHQIDGLVTKPSLLIGHSFGGASALRFALHNPDRVLGLALIEPVFIAAALADPNFKAAATEGDYATLAREGRLEEAARDFFTYNDPTRDWFALPEPARAKMTAQMQLLPATEPGAVSDSGNLLAPGLMEGFTRPVLLIGGERSPPMFAAIINALAKRLPNVETAIIDGAGHMAPMTHPQQTADLIGAWMSAKGLGVRQG
jgi:lipase